MNPFHHPKNSDPETDASLETRFSAHIGNIVAEMKPSARALSRALEYATVTTAQETRLTSEDIAQRAVHPPVLSFFAMLFAPKPIAFAVLSLALVVGIAVVSLSDKSPRASNPMASSDRPSDRSGSTPTDTATSIPNHVPSDPSRTGTVPSSIALDDSETGTAVALLTSDLDSFLADDGYDDSFLADDTDIDSLLVTLDSDINENSF